MREFERFYQPSMRRHMDIGMAVDSLRSGKRVARAGWNGKGIWLVLVRDIEWLGHGHLAPFVAMSPVDGDLVPWLCSLTDLLADDWEEVE